MVSLAVFRHRVPTGQHLPGHMPLQASRASCQGQLWLPPHWSPEASEAVQPALVTALVLGEARGGASLPDVSCTGSLMMAWAASGSEQAQK